MYTIVVKTFKYKYFKIRINKYVKLEATKKPKPQQTNKYFLS